MTQRSAGREMNYCERHMRPLAERLGCARSRHSLKVKSKRTDPVDDIAVESISRSDIRRFSATRWAQLTQEMLNGLAGTAAGPYERALTSLGGLLGAEAFKPAGQGRADSVWIFDPHFWLTLEAKSEADPSGPVSMDDVRQANTAPEPER